MTPSSTVAGYWYAAFDPRVVGIGVHGVVVSQSRYRPVLVAYLAAPVVGAVALGVVGVAVWRASKVDNDVVMVADR